MARTGGFLVGPSIHPTSKLKKHKLKRGVTRDMNAAAGTPVNTRKAYGFEVDRYYASAKAIGPRHGRTTTPPKAKFPGRRRRR
jgi:hypothetical protein